MEVISLLVGEGVHYALSASQVLTKLWELVMQILMWIFTVSCIERNASPIVLAYYCMLVPGFYLSVLCKGSASFFFFSFAKNATDMPLKPTAAG